MAALLYCKLQQYDYAAADLLAGWCFHSRNLSPALIEPLAVLDLDPSKSQAYLTLGILYMRFFRDFEEALKCLNKCTAIGRSTQNSDGLVSSHTIFRIPDPIKMDAYLCRGDLYQQMHLHFTSRKTRTLDSSQSRKRAATGGPARDRGLIGDEYNIKGIVPAMPFIELAIKEYGKAIHLAPSNHLLYLYRGKMALKLGSVT